MAEVSTTILEHPDVMQTPPPSPVKEEVPSTPCKTSSCPMPQYFFPPLPPLPEPLEPEPKQSILEVAAALLGAFTLGVGVAGIIAYQISKQKAA